MSEEKLTKKEKKELRKIEWQEKAKLEERNVKLKKYSVWAGGALLIGLVILGLVWLVNSPSSVTSTEKVNVAPITARDITNGDSKAKLTLIEYSDFQCPACATYHPMVKQLLSDFNGKVYFVYRMFPLTNLHPNSHISAQAAYAAYKQNNLFEMSDLLFTNQKDWAETSDPTGTFMDYARKLKLDLKKFQTDLTSDEVKNYVNASEQQALSEGINSTPTFILNGVKITNPGSYDDLKKLINNELNKK